MKKLCKTAEPSVMVWSIVRVLPALSLTLLLVGSKGLFAQEVATQKSAEQKLGEQKSAEQESGVRDKLFRIEDWSGYNLVTELKDGTSLFSYVSETSSLVVEGSDRAEHSAIFRLTFFARFQCSPLIELIGSLPEDTNEDTRVAVLRNFNQLALTIDGEDHDFPVFVEQQDKDVHSFFNADLAGRNTMKIFVEIGNRATITYGDGSKVDFLLSGSRKAIEQASGRCRSHQ